MKTSLQPIHRSTVKAQLRRGETWTGYLAGNNINAYHIIGGWALGYFVELSTIEQLETTSAAILEYLDPELGNRVVCWGNK